MLVSVWLHTDDITSTKRLEKRERGEGERRGREERERGG